MGNFLIRLYKSLGDMSKMAQDYSKKTLLCEIFRLAYSLARSVGTLFPREL
jgi:hypothetical protein